MSDRFFDRPILNSPYEAKNHELGLEVPYRFQAESRT